MHFAFPVPAEYYRLLAHAGHEIVAGLGDLRNVSHEEPGPGKQVLLLLGVYLLVDEYFPAHRASGHVHHASQRTVPVAMAVLHIESPLCAHEFISEDAFQPIPRCFQPTPESGGGLLRILRSPYSRSLGRFYNHWQDIADYILDY